MEHVALRRSGLHRRSAVQAWLWFLALVVRVVSTQWKLATYPDEFHQYVEPAYFRMHGLGVLPWEFMRGARSWWLTAIYGTALGTLDVLGVHSPYVVYFVLQCVSVGFSMALLWGAVKLAESLSRPAAKRRARLVTLLVFGASPIILSWPMHLLSEPPAAATFVIGWALLERRQWIEKPGRLFGRTFHWDVLGGFVLSACVMMRIVQAPLVPVPVLATLLRRQTWRTRFARVFFIGFGALLAVALFGLIDRLTWGSWFHSTIEYWKFNVTEDGSKQFGVSGRTRYLKWMVASWSFGLAVFAPLVLWQLRSTWHVLLTAGLLLLTLSLTPHKEERFLIPVYALMLLACSIALARISQRLRTWRSVLTGFVPGLLLLGAQTLTFVTTPWATQRGDSPILDLQRSASKHDDLDGLLTPGWYHRTGASFMLGKYVPQAELNEAAAKVPLFNYAIARIGSSEQHMLQRHDYVEIDRVDGYVLVRRASPSP